MDNQQEDSIRSILGDISRDPNISEPFKSVITETISTMCFITHNDRFIDINNTHKKGDLIADYNSIIQKFGKPSLCFDDIKSDYEWQIEFSDGLVAAIYDYKIGINYCGEDEGEILTEGEHSWSIGGSDPRVVKRIQEIIKYS